MKIRTGFVSNSSASSFVISLSDLSADQVENILNHLNYAKKHFPAELGFSPPNDGQDWQPEGGEWDDGHSWVVRDASGKWIDNMVTLDECDGDAWAVEIIDDKIMSYTIVANFNMRRFFDLIGVDPKIVEWCGDEGSKKYWEICHKIHEVKKEKRGEEM